MKPKRLNLAAIGGLRIEGCGEALSFQFTADRTNKAGRREQYEIHVTTCRYVVRQLAEQIAAMQERDRSRIAAQTHRLASELSPLVKP